MKLRLLLRGVVRDGLQHLRLAREGRTLATERCRQPPGLELGDRGDRAKCGAREADEEEIVRHARGMDAPLLQVANAAGVGQNLLETDVVAAISVEVKTGLGVTRVEENGVVLAARAVLEEDALPRAELADLRLPDWHTELLGCEEEAEALGAVSAIDAARVLGVELALPSDHGVRVALVEEGGQSGERAAEDSRGEARAYRLGARHAPAEATVYNRDLGAGEPRNVQGGVHHAAAKGVLAGEGRPRGRGVGPCADDKHSAPLFPHRTALDAAQRQTPLRPLSIAGGALAPDHLHLRAVSDERA
eukprot:scaffold55763_cov75-Phaeocystis_antarctica.AAC.3